MMGKTYIAGIEQRPSLWGTAMITALLRATLVVAISALALGVAGCGGGGGGSSTTSPPTTVVPPLPLPGPYTVACSNVAQDFSRVAPGANATDYWEGSPSASGAPQYMTDILADPADALLV